MHRKQCVLGGKGGEGRGDEGRGRGIKVAAEIDRQREESAAVNGVRHSKMGLHA